MLNAEKMLLAHGLPAADDPTRAKWLLKYGMYSDYVSSTPSLVDSLKIAVIGGNNGYHFVMQVCGKTALKFTFMSYPSCCALQLFHNFYVDSDLFKVDTAFFNELMDAAFVDVLNVFGGTNEGTSKPRWYSKRIQLMMVERRQWTATENAKLREGFFTLEIEPRKNPSIEFKPIYTWAHSKFKVVETLMYNLNTSAVIHNMEVMFDSTVPLCKEYV